MGWFDGWFGSSSSQSDPMSKLDPKLRDFLQRESPVKYSSKSVAAPSKDQQQTIQGQEKSVTSDSDRPPIPAESLYQDGRYAHIWKSYRPRAEVEAEMKSDHEKLMDVLEGYKQRKELIGRAAMENCAIQQEEWRNCMTSGSWEDRLQMCRHQLKAFERCYTMNEVCATISIPG
jgi:hypothetical protein